MVSSKFGVNKKIYWSILPCVNHGDVDQQSGNIDPVKWAHILNIRYVVK